MALLRKLPDVTGSRLFKMAANNPEVHISQLPDKIVWHQMWQNGSRYNGSTYISASRQDIKSVPTAFPQFLGSSNSMELLRILSDSAPDNYCFDLGHYPLFLTAMGNDQVIRPNL
jgi:hypothetical protein